MAGKPTLKTLSTTLGLHPSLISRVLRGASEARVSDQKRALILKTAQEAGYRPDRMGRSLRFQSSKVVAMLTPGITNPFHSLLFRGAESAAQQAGYNVILCHIDDAGINGPELIASVTGGLVDGVLVACAWTPDPRLQVLQAGGLPYVVLNRPSGDPTDTQFVPDDVETGRLAASTLAGLGHQRIAAIFADLRIGNMRGRRDSFVRNLQAEAPGAKLQVFDGMGSKTRLRALVGQLLSDKRGRPTAIFVPHSQHALIVLEEALRHRIPVPEELSILGYGGDQDAALSSVCVPAETMGADGMKALLQLIEAGTQQAGATYRPTVNPGCTLAAPPSWA